MQALLDKGAEVNAKDTATALMAASQEGHLEVVQALLAKGAIAEWQSLVTRSISDLNMTTTTAPQAGITGFDFAPANSVSTASGGTITVQQNFNRASRWMRVSDSRVYSALHLGPREANRYFFEYRRR